MFSLSKFETTFFHLNLRDELHGDEHKTGADLAFKLQGPSAMLATIDSSLEDAIYLPVDTKQKPIDGVLAVRTKLRTGLLKYPLQITYELVGRNLVLWYGIESEQSRVDVPLTKVNKFTLVAAAEGGLIELTFRAQKSDIDPTLAGALTGLLAQKVRLSIEVSEEADSTETKPRQSTDAKQRELIDKADAATKEFINRASGAAPSEGGAP